LESNLKDIFKIYLPDFIPKDYDLVDFKWGPAT